MKYLILFVSLSLLATDSYALFGSDEDILRLEEQAKLLTVKLNIAQEKIQKYEQELSTLREENTRLKVEAASLKSSVNSGKMLEEENKAIEKRQQELKRFEQYLQEKDARISVEEKELQERRQAFFEEANETQRQIGRAEQLEQDYEYMKTARNEAEAKLIASQQQATFHSQRLVYALVICGMVIIGLVTWVIIILSRYAKQREETRAELATIDAEAKKRQDAIQFWEKQASLPEDESQKVKAALEQFLK